MFTTASVFFKTLADVGITHAFVNWGSDHCAFLEDLHRQRAENAGRTLVEVVVCPSEYVALSAAHGYACVTGKPAVVIVQGDVGTQALAGAIHNADRGHVPVLIFAETPPFATGYRELRDSQNEFNMRLQDVPDQAGGVRQYMRHVAQIQCGKHVSQTIMRALQIATSEPKGPVYLWARREIIDEDAEETAMNTVVSMKKWPSVMLPALSAHAVNRITSALVHAKFPLIIAANVGRDPISVAHLASLSSTLAIGTLAVTSSVASLPYSHPHHLGYVYAGRIPHLADADVLLVINADVPWIDASNDDLSPNLQVFVIDSDPLKRTFGWSHVDASMLCTADTGPALSQLLDALRAPTTQAALSAAPVHAILEARRARLATLRAAWDTQLARAEGQLAADGIAPSVPGVLAAVREAARTQTLSGSDGVLWMNEGVSAAGLAWNHVGAERPGSMFMSGGSSLGWVLGASVGASIGVRVVAGGESLQLGSPLCQSASPNPNPNPELVVAITGDGNFLFALPTAAYWLARGCGTPFLTVVLNNRGWFSPKFSLQSVHPDGHGSSASGERLSVGFGEDVADYGGIAAAAGGAWARRVERADELKNVLEEAVRVVLHEKRCAVVDCVVQSI